MVRGDRTGSDTKSKYSGYMGKQSSNAEFSGDNRDQRGYAYWCALWLSECIRIVKPGGVALLFTDWRQLVHQAQGVDLALRHLMDVAREHA